MYKQTNYSPIVLKLLDFLQNLFEGKKLPGCQHDNFRVVTSYCLRSLTGCDGQFFKISGGFFGGSSWGLWGHHHWGSCSQEEGGDGETEEDLDVVCANYVTPEPQVWEEMGVTPDKVSAVPEDLVTMEFSSGTVMLHENRYLSTDKVVS